MSALPPSKALGDIQIAMKVLSGGMERDEHPTDRHYHGLKCNLSPVEPGDEVFKVSRKGLVRGTETA